LNPARPPTCCPILLRSDRPRHRTALRWPATTNPRREVLNEGKRPVAKPFSRARWIGHSGLKERVGVNKTFALEGHVLVCVSNFQQNLEGNLDERRPKRLTEIRIQEHNGRFGVRLFQRKPRLGALLLGSWLIATGILHLVPRISFSGSGEILAVLAIAAGVLLVLDR
jgi:hypothetical protein